MRLTAKSELRIPQNSTLTHIDIPINKDRVTGQHALRTDMHIHTDMQPNRQTDTDGRTDRHR